MPALFDADSMVFEDRTCSHGLDKNLVELYGSNQSDKENLDVSQQLLIAQTQHTEVSCLLRTFQKDLAKIRQTLSKALEEESYDPKSGIGYDCNGKSVAKLEIEIISAEDLPRMNLLGGKADPYVIISLHPEFICPCTKSQKTEIRWKTLSPTWKQDFVFAPIESRTGFIHLKVMDAENFQNDAYIGETTVPLTDFLNQQEQARWYTLRDLQTEALEDPHEACPIIRLVGRINVSVRFTFSKVLPLQYSIHCLEKRESEAKTKLLTLQNQVSNLESRLQEQHHNPTKPAVLESTPSVPLLWNLSEFLHGDNNLDSNKEIGVSNQREEDQRQPMCPLEEKVSALDVSMGSNRDKKSPEEEDESEPQIEEKSMAILRSPFEEEVKQKDTGDDELCSIS